MTCRALGAALGTRPTVRNGRQTLSLPFGSVLMTPANPHRTRVPSAKHCNKGRGGVSLSLISGDGSGALSGLPRQARARESATGISVTV